MYYDSRKLMCSFLILYFDYFQIFADLRAQNVRVIIADFFVFAARAVMCEAWRQVQIQVFVSFTIQALLY